MPSFPFRNTIVIDTKGKEEEIFARPCLPGPSFEKTRRPIIWAPHFPYQNYVHIRNPENILQEEIPAPPQNKGVKFGKFSSGGTVGTSAILRNRFKKAGLEDDKLTEIKVEKTSVENKTEEAK